MIQDLFDKNVFIYTMAGMCTIGVLIKFAIAIIYKCLIKASENMGSTKNKLMKMLKLKFEACYKLNIGVNNVDVFVDKYVYKYKFCGVLLYTWENFGGQILILCMLTGTVSAGLGLYNECGRREILSTFFMGILTSALLIMFESFINLPAKRNVLKANISDYLDNFLKVRLEKEYFNPELLEEYRNEYFDILAKGEESKKSKSRKKEKRLENRVDENKETAREIKREIKKVEKEAKLSLKNEAKIAQKEQNKKNPKEVKQEASLLERQKAELKKESRQALHNVNQEDSMVENQFIKTSIAEDRLNADSHRSASLKEEMKDHMTQVKDDINHSVKTDNEQIEELLNSLIKSALNEKQSQEKVYEKAKDSKVNEKVIKNQAGQVVKREPITTLENKSDDMLLDEVTSEMILKEFTRRKNLKNRNKVSGQVLEVQEVQKDSKKVEDNTRIENQWKEQPKYEESLAATVEKNLEEMNVKIEDSNIKEQTDTDHNNKKEENRKISNSKKLSKIYEINENDGKIIEDILKEFLA